MADWEALFFRVSNGAELDLVLQWDRKRLAFELKVSDATKPTRSFWQAIEDITPDITYVVAPNAVKYPIKKMFGLLELMSYGRFK